MHTHLPTFTVYRLSRPWTTVETNHFFPIETAAITATIVAATIVVGNAYGLILAVFSCSLLVWQCQ